MNWISYYQMDNHTRYLNPQDITIENGYKIEVFAEGLDSLSCILFTEEGELIVTNSGYTSGRPNVSILRNGRFEIISDDFNVPLLGINYRQEKIYVSHKGIITVLSMDGTSENIIVGLPSYGDYSNSRVDFGLDGKMYFGQGSATNSGVVGDDNLWVPECSFFCDMPGMPVILKGQNFSSKNVLSKNSSTRINTGAYSPFGEMNLPNELRKGVIKATGSIMRANIDGSNLELVAWGLRCPTYIKFNDDKLYVSNIGYDMRGSRPIANAPDEFILINDAFWYGFPDYSGGEPVTLPRFRPDGGVQPEFLFVGHPNIPPKPFSLFPTDSSIVGFDFNNHRSFGDQDDIFITEFGSIQLNTIGGFQQNFPLSGYKISKINSYTGRVSTFAMNKSGFPSYISREGGFGRPVDIAFGPDDALYVADMGTSPRENPNMILPNTGVIWKITRLNQ